MVSLRRSTLPYNGILNIEKLLKLLKRMRK